MKLEKIKLNNLAENSLANREMKEIKGGKCCTCSCAYADTGGSSPKDNRAANYNIGDNGGHSTSGDNYYFMCIEVGPLT